MDKVATGCTHFEYIGERADRDLSGVYCLPGFTEFGSLEEPVHQIFAECPSPGGSSETSVAELSPNLAADDGLGKVEFVRLEDTSHDGITYVAWDAKLALDQQRYMNLKGPMPTKTELEPVALVLVELLGTSSKAGKQRRASF